MTHLLICGCRWYGNLKSYIKDGVAPNKAKILVKRNRTLFFRRVDEIVASLESPITIISGAAYGTDTLAIEYAQARNYPCEQYPAKWYDGNGVFQRNAGIQRNGTMVDKSTHVIAFWDYTSAGTRDSIRRTEKADKPLWIVDLRGMR